MKIEDKIAELKQIHKEFEKNEEEELCPACGVPLEKRGKCLTCPSCGTPISCG